MNPLGSEFFGSVSFLGMSKMVPTGSDEPNWGRCLFCRVERLLETDVDFIGEPLGDWYSSSRASGRPGRLTEPLRVKALNPL